MPGCLHCGKPLGGRLFLCYGCHSDGIDPVDIVDPDPTVVDRVEEYFLVASVRCSECGDLHGTVTHDGTEYTAEDFGIDSLDEWQRELDTEEAWMREHTEAVEHALPTLAEEWPHPVDALRSTVL
jgi:hypothetical protein